MIARVWRGVVRADDADEYAAYVQDTGIESYKQTPGNLGAWLLRRPDGDREEIVTLSFWDSVPSIEAFAGADIDRAVYYPEDERYLLERDPHVVHYQVPDAE
ncbi:MAG TPA: antibiotic biosynthesis monooxygenase [Streptosporangiaceae bacterium]|jgi:heme-degrading monooxygenase HmoA|nr:antibiotic biosynthesis monooxygenase [Streptosporangiaceae bacterium]